MFQVTGQSVTEDEWPAPADHLVMELDAPMLKVTTHSLRN